MTPIQWIIALIALAFIAIAMISYIRERQRVIPTKEAPMNHGPRVMITDEKPEELFIIPRATEGATPKYAVIDLQTTGLSTVEGKEDKIVELSWLILDEEYREIKRHTYRVLQPTAGSFEAKQIHRITETALVTTGKDEHEVLQDFWSDTHNVPIWVFHNAHFDLSILRAAFRHHSPTLEQELLHKTVLCTMTYLTADQEKMKQYPSLLNLTASLYHQPLFALTQLSIVSLRNTLLTRACLIKLLQLYPHLLPQNYPLSASHHLGL